MLALRLIMLLMALTVGSAALGVAGSRQGTVPLRGGRAPRSRPRCIRHGSRRMRSAPPGSRLVTTPLAAARAPSSFSQAPWISGPVTPR
jgi:hypothetical protein